MKILRRLIYREASLAVAYVTVAFLALFFFFDMIDELRWVSREPGGYQLSHALLTVVLRLAAGRHLPAPRAALQWLPVIGVDIAAIFLLQIFQVGSLNYTALLAIPAAGLSLNDTVLLAQLIGFVAYQARLLAGVKAMGELGGVSEAPAAQPVDAAPFVHPANLPPPGEPLRRNGFTSETLGWKAWLEVLNPETATPEQQHVLEVSHPKAKTMDFYLLLARQPQVLLERSQAFNAIMYAPGGLSRAEREVAATAVSRSNGCVYCASVHAQRFEQLAKRNDVMAQLFDEPDTAGTNARERAIIQSSLALTRAPGSFGVQNVQPLRDAGLSDLEILDMLHSAALFGWANRLMLNLGVEIYTP